MLSLEMCSKSKNKMLLISCCIEFVDELKARKQQKLFTNFAVKINK